MSLPPPPGLKPSAGGGNPYSSLPPRPPSATNTPSPYSSKPAPPGVPGGDGTGSTKPAYNAFSTFAPRSITHSNFRPQGVAHHAASTTPSNMTMSQYPPHSHYSAPTQGHFDSQAYSSGSSMPQIRNPFAPSTSATSAAAAFGGQNTVDPEYEAQIAQWQSAYVNKDDTKSSTSHTFRRDGATAANTVPLGTASRLDVASPIGPHVNNSTHAGNATTPTSSIGPSLNNSHSNVENGITDTNQSKTVHRSGGGTSWTDNTLLEWDPAHFRLFVGNLAGEVTDESLLKAFSKYPSVQKARVVRDKRTTKSKGYGFVSFSDGDEYFAAGREMQGKYIGSHPVLLKRSNTEVRPEVGGGHHRHQHHQRGDVGSKNGKHGRGGKNGVSAAGGAGMGGGSGSVGSIGMGKKEHGGISKKQIKTKGGLRVLG